MIIANDLAETHTKKDYCVDCVELIFIASRHQIPRSWKFWNEESQEADGLTHRVAGVDTETKEEMKSTGMGCDLIVAFVV